MNSPVKATIMSARLKMLDECKLKAEDMFQPKPDGEKPIQTKGYKR